MNSPRIIQISHLLNISDSVIAYENMKPHKSHSTCKVVTNNTTDNLAINKYSKYSLNMFNLKPGFDLRDPESRQRQNMLFLESTAEV